MCKYNRDLVEQRINEFKSKNYDHNEITIYFDMDNTLCLFSVYGQEDASMKAMYSKGFYRELPCFSEAPAVLENLQNLGYKVKILSSCIDSPYCIPEKKAWVKYHLPFIDDKDIILIPNGSNKAAVIENIESSILVDDYYHNIVGVYEAGGVGVKKTYSGKERPIPQVANLVDIFSVLDLLNCL